MSYSFCVSLRRVSDRAGEDLTHRMLVRGGPSMGKCMPTKIFLSFYSSSFFLRPARVITVAARGRKKGNLKTFIIFPSIFLGGGSIF
jgi:hypothetical protein